MRSFIIVVLTALMLPCAGLLGVAQAAELNTPVIQSGNSASLQYVCVVTNLGKKTIEVVLDLIDFDGVVFNSTNRSVAPGTSEATAGGGDSAFSGRCRVAGKLGKKKVVVNLTLRDASSNIT